MHGTVPAFRRTVRGTDPEIDVARAALLIARIEYPTLAIDGYLARLDELGARSGARRTSDPLRRLHQLREFLFEEEGFRGNVADYYDPRNSFLNDVLDRRLGIPITLSLVLIEVGRRVGLAVEGVGLPGHFVVRARIDGAPVFLDPFNGGGLVTPDACADLARRALGRRLRLADEHLLPVTRRQLLARLLANLKAIYWQREEWPRALAVVEHLLALDPAAAPEVRDRGTVLTKLGDYRHGLADWERYLVLAPQAPDAEAVRGELRRARMSLAALN